MYKKALAISGPSGAGKSSIIKEFISRNKDEFAMPWSATTRPPRHNNEEYIFLSTQEFKNKIESNEFFEYNEVYNGIYYGTLKSEFEKIWARNATPIFDIDVDGALAIKEKLRDCLLLIFIEPGEVEDLYNRIRGERAEAEVKKRIERIEYELSKKNKFDEVIINKDGLLEESVKKLKEITESFLDK